MNETKQERKRRKARERKAKQRLRERHKKQIKEQGKSTDFFAVKNEMESRLRLINRDIEIAKEECILSGKPLWTSKKIKALEEKIEKMIESGALPKPKPTKKFHQYHGKNICPNCGRLYKNCICSEEKQESWLKFGG